MIDQTRAIRSLLFVVCLVLLAPISARAQDGGPAATPIAPASLSPQGAPASQPDDVRIQDVGEFYITVGVTMQDGGPIPYGLTWSLVGDNWTTLDSGPVTGGITSFSTTTTVAVPNGGYGLWITGGGYSSGQAIRVNGADTGHTFNLQRSVVSVSFPITTSNGVEIPAGTAWSITDANNDEVASGTLSAALPSGWVWGPETLERGIYTLSIDAPGFNAFSTPVDLTSLQQTEFSVDVTLQQLTSTITFDISMSDGGPLPNGLVWTLYPNGSWDPIATGDVPAGELSFSGSESVPYGIYSFWVQGSGYSSGQALNANTAETPHVLTLDRKMATADVTLTTSDGRDIPAGTTFTLLNSRGELQTTFTSTTAQTSPMTWEGPATLEFDAYTLTVNAPGFYPLVVDMPVTNAWKTEYHFSGELQPMLSTVSFTVSMSDGGPLPYGLQWALDPGFSGEIPQDDDLFSYTIDEPVELGVYALWVTGSGYSSGQVLNVTGPETHHDVVLDRLTGTLTVTLATSDEGDVPAGTAWELLDAGNNVVQSGVLENPIPNGGTLPLDNPIEFGVYTLHMNAAAPDGIAPLAIGILPREILPFSMTINVTDPWSSEYDVTANLEIAPTESNVSFSVSMSDNGPLPNGLQVSLIPDGTWDPYATVDVPAGDTAFDGMFEEVPFGIYSIWVTGNGYSSGQVLNITSPETRHDFVLDRLSGDLTITLDTSDDAEVPAGTTWSISDSAGTVIQEGTLDAAIADGGTLPIANPFEFDVYTLTIDAEGYHPFSMALPVTNPWTQEFAFTANLISDREPEPTETPAPSPTVTPIATPGTPVPTETAPATPGTPAPTETATPGTPAPTDTATPAPISGLPKTGQGSHDGAHPSVALLAAASLMVLIGAAGLRLRGARRP